MMKIKTTQGTAHSMHRLSALLFLISFSLMSLACSSQNRMTHLKDTLRNFNQQVRWNNWPRAASHVDADARKQWLEARIANAQNLKMSEVRLVRVTSDGPRATEAKVMVSLTWYRTADMKVKTSYWLQTWSHTPHGWRLAKEERQAAEPPPSQKQIKSSWP